MFVAGITNSVVFGVGVTGISPAHLKRVRSQAVKAFGCGRPLCSYDLGMVLHGRHDPVVEAITGPLCQYAAEWWRATDDGTSSRLVKRWAWSATASGISRCVGRYRECCARCIA